MSDLAGAGDGEVREAFAGEMRIFRIRLGEIRAIEARCGNVGIGEVCRRLARATYVLSELSGTAALAAGLEIRADDVRETIYQGLVGGGMKANVAFRLVTREIDDRGWRGLTDNLDTALLALLGSQRRPEGEDAGELRAGPTTEPTPPNPPTSPASTVSVPPSALDPATSID